MLFLLTLLRCAEKNSDDIVAPWYPALNLYADYLDYLDTQPKPYRTCMLLYYDDDEWNTLCEFMVEMKPAFVSAKAQLYSEEKSVTATTSTSGHFAKVFKWIKNLQKEMKDPFAEITQANNDVHVSSFASFKDNEDYKKYFAEKNCLVIDNCNNLKSSAMYLHCMLIKLSVEFCHAFKPKNRFLLFNLIFETDAEKEKFEQQFRSAFNSAIQTYALDSTGGVIITYPSDKDLAKKVESLDASRVIAACYFRKDEGADLELLTISHEYCWHNGSILYSQIINNICYCVVNNWETQAQDVKYVKDNCNFVTKCSYQITLHDFTVEFVLQIFIWDEPISESDSNEYIYVLLLRKKRKITHYYDIHRVPKKVNVVESIIHQNEKIAQSYAEENKQYHKSLVDNCERVFFYNSTDTIRQYIPCEYFWDKKQESFSPNSREMDIHYFDKDIMMDQQVMETIKTKCEHLEDFKALEYRVFSFDLSSSMIKISSDIHKNMVNVKKINLDNGAVLTTQFVIWIKFEKKDGIKEWFKVICCPNITYFYKVLENYKKEFSSNDVCWEKYTFKNEYLKIENPLLVWIEVFSIYKHIYGNFDIHYKLVLMLVKVQIEQGISQLSQEFIKNFKKVYTSSVVCRGLFFHPLLHAGFVQVLQSDSYNEFYLIFSKIVAGACDPIKHNNLTPKNILMIERPTPAFAPLHQILQKELVKRDDTTTENFNKRKIEDPEEQISVKKIAS